MAAILVVASGAGSYQQLTGTLRIDHAIKSLSGASMFVPHPILFNPSVVRMPPGVKSLIDFNSHIVPFNFSGLLMTPPTIFWWPTTSNPGNVVFVATVAVISVDSSTISVADVPQSPLPVPSGKTAVGVVTVPTGFPVVVNPQDPNTIYVCQISRDGSDAGDTYPDDILIGHAYTDLVIP